MSIRMTALCYPAAWEQGVPIAGGMAHAQELQAAGLDFSVASLARIDALLDHLREAHHPSHDDVVKRQDLQNLLFLLAFHTGEVIARSQRCAPLWQTHDELARTEPAFTAVVQRCFEHFLNVRFPGARGMRLGELMPLYALTTRLCDEDGGGKSIAFSADGCIPPEFGQGGPRHAEPLPPLPPQGLPVDLATKLGAWTAEQRKALDMPRPNWLEGDDLERLFDAGEAIFEGGRVAWGALVQANNVLFDPTKDMAAPGEVLYDPQGRFAPEDLSTIAAAAFNLRKNPPADPALVAIADYLNDERQRVFALDAPLTPYPLKISSTFLDQRHFAGGCILLRHFPIVLHDEFPGLVRLLPHPFWPDDFRRQWLAAAKPDSSPEPPPRPPVAAAKPNPTAGVAKAGVAPQAPSPPRPAPSPAKPESSPPAATTRDQGDAGWLGRLSTWLGKKR